MFGEIIKGILGILWAIVRAIILEAVATFLWAATLSVIVYPIAAIGQIARAMLGGQDSYNSKNVDRIGQRAFLGVFVLLVLWSGTYFLFGPYVLLVTGGITLLVAVLGWFDKVVVPHAD
jgi:hypothetical protein